MKPDQKFLFKVAEEISSLHPDDMSNVVIVLPAKRARLYLRKYLSRSMNKPFWSPSFVIMPELISDIAGKKIASELELMLLLYDSYLKVVDQPEDFSSFLKWAPIVQKDYNDIDSNLADVSRVFSDLRDIKEIEGWSFNSEHLSTGQLSYLDFWVRLGALHETFVELQNQNGKWSYQSLLRFQLNDDSIISDNVRGKKYYFVGMASFSPAEQRLIEKIRDATSCQLFWDIDKFYLDNIQHEAGYFARRAFKNLSPQHWVGEYFATGKKNIQCYECTTSVAQAMAVCDQLKSMSVEELNDTCVVLGDMSSVEVLLSNISDLKVTVNIAAGILLKGSLSAKWINSFFQLRVKLDKDQRGMHYGELSGWIQLLSQLNYSSSSCLDFMRNLRKSNQVFLDWKSLENFAFDFPALSHALQLFNVNLKVEEVLKNLLDFVVELKSDDAFIVASKNKMIEVLDQLAVLCSTHKYLIEWPAVQALYDIIAGKESIYYEGEPVDGLQVLSMVETRALDFSHVFVLDVNENFLPGNSSDQSFIPSDLRDHHHLPMPIEREAMFAYTFYRLVQRASDIRLFYSSVSAEFRGTEHSRYITQMKAELPTYNSEIIFHDHKLKLKDVQKGVQSILNSDFARKRLDEICANGLSPSSINKFNSCPLDFYYRYIVGLGEENSPEEHMSSATFGSVIHFVLEKFYFEHKGNYPKKKDYIDLKNSLDDRLKIAIASEYNTRYIDSGFNHLAMSVARNMLLNIIQYEIKLLEVRDASGVSSKLVDVEFGLRREVDIAKYNWYKPVAIKGKVDRLDDVNGIHHILDYKTGKVASADVVLNSDIAKLFEDGKSSKQLQLLSYLYMYTTTGKPVDQMRAGFYSFVNHGDGYNFLSGKDKSVDNSTLEEFEAALMEWVKQLYELEKFEHNVDNAYCEYCR